MDSEFPVGQSTPGKRWCASLNRRSLHGSSELARHVAPDPAHRILRVIALVVAWMVDARDGRDPIVIEQFVRVRDERRDAPNGRIVKLS